jgi:hypothetical protein
MNKRLHVGWWKKFVKRLYTRAFRIDVEKALRWQYARGLLAGTNICYKHEMPVKRRVVSIGVWVCDQCQLDAHIHQWFDGSPNTGPIEPVESPLTVTQRLKAFRMPTERLLDTYNRTKEWRKHA